MSNFLFVFDVFFKFYLFLIEGELLYNIGFISAIYQHDLAIGIHVPSLFECQILKYHLEVSRSCDSGALNAPAERMQTAWDDCSGELNCSFINLPCESMMSSVPSEFGLRSPRPPTQAAILSPRRREGPAFINDSRSKRRRT